jgi:eukaryotic-like serine/threonine-protein kinase
MNQLKSNLQIGRSIGAGWFGEVHLGQDDVQGIVAVKIFRQQPTESDTEWDRRKAALLREGQHLRRAAHPNVVRVHYLVESEHGDAVYLVTLPRWIAAGAL